MKNTITRDSIKYLGISLDNKFNNSNFKLFILPYVVEMDSNYFDIDYIIQVDCNINILNYKVITTPKCTSLEGHTLTGNKVFFKGIINTNIKYTSYDESKKLYSNTSTNHFVENIELPSTFSSDLKTISIVPNIIDISAVKIDNRRIYLTLSIYISILF